VTPPSKRTGAADRECPDSGVPEGRHAVAAR
jgi:hypothetical protein